MQYYKKGSLFCNPALLQAQLATLGFVKCFYILLFHKNNYMFSLCLWKFPAGINKAKLPAVTVYCSEDRSSKLHEIAD